MQRLEFVVVMRRLVEFSQLQRSSTTVGYVAREIVDIQIS